MAVGAKETVPRLSFEFGADMGNTTACLSISDASGPREVRLRGQEDGTVFRFSRADRVSASMELHQFVHHVAVTFKR
jgi:hypothetical protein